MCLSETVGRDSPLTPPPSLPLPLPPVDGNDFSLHFSYEQLDIIPTLFSPRFSSSRSTNRCVSARNPYEDPDCIFLSRRARARARETCDTRCTWRLSAKRKDGATKKVYLIDRSGKLSRALRESAHRKEHMFTGVALSRFGIKSLTIIAIYVSDRPSVRLPVLANRFFNVRYDTLYPL